MNRCSVGIELLLIPRYIRGGVGFLFHLVRIQVFEDVFLHMLSCRPTLAACAVALPCFTM